MSVVACRVLDGGYEMAADSISVRGYTQTRGSNTAFTKLFEVNGMDIGASGTAEEAQLMRLFAGTHRPARADELAVLEFLASSLPGRTKRQAAARWKIPICSASMACCST